MKLNEKIIKKHTKRYYKDLANYERLQQLTESTTEMAFKTLLKNVGDENDFVLIKPYQSLFNDKKIIPDGIITTSFGRYLGYWEAKDTADDLDKEIYKKLQKGYPRNNTIFEATKTAVLYQDAQEVGRYNLKNEEELVALLLKFFAYNEPIVEEFKRAVEKFKENIPRLALAMQEKIYFEKKNNPEFIIAIKGFLKVCADSFHSDITEAEVEDMLIQHLLTERIFRKIFDNPDFVNKNVIAVQLEKLVYLLTRSVFTRSEFFKDIDFFYITIEEEAAKIDNESEKQSFLNNVYELFFQSYSKRNADTKGIVYTPQVIVRFMVKFTNVLLEQEFGKNISDNGVTIIDPCVGTGNFIVEILKNLHPLKLTYKYENELFCNELMLLPYYIASVNIEYFYYKQVGKYKPFENIVFTDTLELIKEPEKPQKALFSFNEINTRRAQNQLNTDFVVIIGNPPYNLKQSRDFGNRNDNHEIIDKIIAETYVKSSTATLKQINYDPYIKFIRWASNRLHQENGVVCFITNNVFMHSTASDGIRKHLMQDFHRIYHVDLGGDMRVNKKEVKGNIFGITVGVGISFFVKNDHYQDHKIFYLNLRNEDFSKEDYLKLLEDLTEQNENIDGFKWVEGKLVEGRFVFSEENEKLSEKYHQFMPLFNKEGNAIFHSKTPGIKTDRDDWVYHISKQTLAKRVKIMIQSYNAEIDRLKKYLKQNNLEVKNVNLARFVDYDIAKIKWSEGLKKHLANFQKTKFDAQKIVFAMFRPFVNKYLYHDNILIDRPSNVQTLMQFENQFISITGLGAQKPFGCLIADTYIEHGMTVPGQIFPLYYLKNGQKESNITDWILQKLQVDLNNEKINKEQIFYYVYGILHHEQFRDEFALPLKMYEPKIPISLQNFSKISEIGKKLAELHLNFQESQEYPVKILENPQVAKHYAVEKLVFSKKDGSLLYNDCFTIFFPENIHEYKICGKSPIQWICNQYSHTNFEDATLIRLMQKVTTVSLKTLEYLKELSDIDFLSEIYGKY